MASVVIVQKQMDAARELERVLTEAGYQVVGLAHSFHRAARIVRSASIELALVDYRLAGPVLGVAVAKYFQHRGAKVIYVTADQENVLRIDPQAEIVSKPYTKQQLLETIERVIQPAQT